MGPVQEEQKSGFQLMNVTDQTRSDLLKKQQAKERKSSAAPYNARSPLKIADNRIAESLQYVEVHKSTMNNKLLSP
jgi:hypothetical protein